MMRTRLFAILLLNVTLCAAQDSAAPTYAVRGVIVNAQTNQPIVRAEVILNQEFAVLTGDEGRFEFDRIPAGDFQLSVQRPGYLSIGSVQGARLGRSAPLPSLRARHIRVGPDMPDLTLRLVPTGSIRGQISLSGSDQADGIRVSSWRKRTRNGVARWEMAETARTDSEGVFYLGDMAPGSYMLFTEPSLDRPAIGRRNAVTWGYPAVYYPGVTDSASAGTLMVASGQTVEADFVLTRQAFYPFTAQVLAAEPGNHVGVQILDGSGRMTSLPARYDPQGQIVHANVPNGSWILQAQSFGGSQLFGRTAFQISNGPADIGVTLLPIPKLQVTVRREFTSTSETGAMATLPNTQANVQLENAEPFGMGGMMGSHFEPTTDNSSGTTTGTIDAMPGRYWVQANTWGAYVSSVTSGGVDLVSNPLLVSPSNSNAPIEVVLRNDFGTITVQTTGQAVSGSAVGAASQTGEVPEIHVYAIPLFPSESRNLNAMAMGNGQFRLPQLAPGSYRVVACDSEQEIDSRSPEGLAAWASKGQVVTVDAGGTATVQLAVLHVEEQP